MAYGITKMSSRGQIVIPEEVRESLNFKSGSNFFVIPHGDSVILRPIEEPSLDDLPGILEKTRAFAKDRGIAPKDVKQALKKIRSNKK
jgi:AbrB family looped-hinge helix DNA binding protein